MCLRSSKGVKNFIWNVSPKNPRLKDGVVYVSPEYPSVQCNTMSPLSVPVCNVTQSTNQDIIKPLAWLLWLAD